MDRQQGSILFFIHSSIYTFHLFTACMVSSFLDCHYFLFVLENNYSHACMSTQNISIWNILFPKLLIKYR